MARRLPPLNALRAFEAGARHLSFTKAAGELNVTQAAISHQVRQLEDHFGVKLFRRLTRELALTEAGRMLVPAASDAFDRIAEAARRVRAEPETPTLSVSVTPSFGARWLAPRLGHFWRQHPAIDLRLHHSMHNVDFAREECDMAVRYGCGDWPGLAATFIIRSGMAPVCSPGLIAGGCKLDRPEDLRHVTLLHEYDHEDWALWLKAAGLSELVDARRGPVIDDPTTLDHALLAGQGVALGRVSLIRARLRQGELVQPFDLDIETDYAYYAVHLPGSPAIARIEAFRDFLLEEAALEDTELCVEPARSGG